MDKSEIIQSASNAYYVNANMIKFLLVENLALKTLLHEKGLITAEEYKITQEKAATILQAKEQEQLLLFFQKMLEQKG